MTTTVTQNKRPTAQAILSIFNLGCSSCSSIIERKLKKVAGITNVTVNYVTDTVLVKYDPSQLTVDEIRVIIRKSGYEAGVKH